MATPPLKCLGCAKEIDGLRCLYVFQHAVGEENGLHMTMLCLPCAEEVIANPAVMNPILYSKMEAHDRDK